MPLTRTSPSLHYGWVIVATGTLTLFACLGLARYAYAMLLPGMQSGLGLAYDRMGFIGTGNFTGYLLSVLLAPWLIRRWQPRYVVAGGLLLIGLCMLALSQSQSFASAFALYFCVGMGGGFANIPLMTVVTRWFRREQRGKAIGLVIGGNGVAIVFAGLLIPALNQHFGADGWRHGWLLLGLISLVVAAVVALLLRNDPAELGLDPVGRPVPVAPENLVPVEHHGDGRTLLHLGLLYLAFGATFMVFGTFCVTTMVKEYGLSDARAGFYWSWVGLFSLFSGVGFGALSDRIGRKYGLALVFALQSIAYALFGLHLGDVGLIVAIILYGATVFAIPSIMTAAVADYLGLARAAGAFATVTLFFALGQTLGPSAAGVIAKATGSFQIAYLLASLCTVSATLGAFFLPPPHANRD